jgi:NADH:ubiquinone oxidoreductase subunit C
MSTVILYESSNWLEREAWDMYGIKFLLHPIYVEY